MLLNGSGGAGAILWHIEEFMALTDREPKIACEEGGDLLVLNGDWQDVPRTSSDIIIRLQAEHLEFFQRSVFPNFGECHFDLRHRLLSGEAHTDLIRSATSCGCGGGWRRRWD